jgi:hypothetical protein
MMLELLRHITDSPGLSSRELARKLAAEGTRVDMGLVEMAILELEQKGYLRRETPEGCALAGRASESGAPSSCSFCPLQCADRGIATWALTDKALGTVSRRALMGHSHP